MHFIRGALILATFPYLISLFIAAVFNVTVSRDINLICNEFTFIDSDCFFESYLLGARSIFIYLFFYYLTGNIDKKILHNNNNTDPVLVVNILLILMILFSLVFAYKQINGDFYLDRMEYIAIYSLPVSISNLLYPVFIFFILKLENARARFIIGLMIILFCLINPYRSIYINMAYLSIIYILSRHDYKRLRLKKTLISFALLVAAIIISSLITINRAPIGDKGGISELKDNYVNRLALPQYQLLLADGYKNSSDMPSVFDGILAKFKLGEVISKNNYLYSIGHDSSIGEVTIGPFGEGLLIGFIYPEIWMFIGIFLSILIYNLLYDLTKIDLGPIIGLFLLRVSFGGFMQLLPSLVIQVVMVLLIMKMSRSENN